MTDFRARGTIMGPAGLTAVFGMGTGVTPPVWSPESRPAGGQAGPGVGNPCGSGHAGPVGTGPGGKPLMRVVAWRGVDRWFPGTPRFVTPPTAAPPRKRRHGVPRFGKRSSLVSHRRPAARGMWGAGRGGQAVGCWDWSAAAVARRTLPAHRPGRLPGAFVAHRDWKPRLEEGFALRCLQRLSFPDLATRRCPEQDSRHTRGRSSPILSY